MGPTQEKLIRKQFLLSKNHVEKIEKLAAENGNSAGNIVRSAIVAYNPNNEQNESEQELLELAVANERI
jgi:hypothetical protein